MLVRVYKGSKRIFAVSVNIVWRQLHGLILMPTIVWIIKCFRQLFSRRVQELQSTPIVRELDAFRGTLATFWSSCFYYHQILPPSTCPSMVETLVLPMDWWNNAIGCIYLNSHIFFLTIFWIMFLPLHVSVCLFYFQNQASMHLKRGWSSLPT